MKLILPMRIVILLCLVICWVSAAEGSVGDPQVIVGGGRGSLPVGSHFKFISPSGSSPVSVPNGSPCVVITTKGRITLPGCLFRNQSGFRWNTLTFDISPTGQAGPFSCAALAFFSGCVFNDEGSKVTFFGGTGIRRGDYFVVAVISWAPGTLFRGTGALTTAWLNGTGSDVGAAVPRPEPRNTSPFGEWNVALVKQSERQAATMCS